jgi:hypothetical protein
LSDTAKIDVCTSKAVPPGRVFVMRKTSLGALLMEFLEPEKAIQHLVCVAQDEMTDEMVFAAAAAFFAKESEGVEPAELWSFPILGPTWKSTLDDTERAHEYPDDHPNCRCEALWTQSSQMDWDKRFEEVFGSTDPHINEFRDR